MQVCVWPERLAGLETVVCSFSSFVLASLQACKFCAGLGLSFWLQVVFGQAAGL